MTYKLNLKEKKRLSEILKSFSKARVLVVGDFILDQFLWGSVERISPEAPVPVVNVQRESYMPGGALNVAHNIRTLSGVVYPCGVVGRDLEGRMLVKAMRREGIDTGGVLYHADRRTAVKTRVIAHSQQVVRFDREKTDEIARESVASILRFAQQKIASTDVIIIEDYGKGVIQPALVKSLIALAKKSKKPIVIDPKEKHFSYYKGATAITPNRKEAYGAVLNGGHGRSYTTAQVGKKLLQQLSLKAVLMTLGEDGMCLFEKNGPATHIPTVAREVFDVSGAGDTVIAVFCLALAVGASLKEAAILSNLAAGIVVGKLGTATVSSEEIRKSLEHFASK